MTKMMDEFERGPEKVGEKGESRGTEEEKLQDATLYPHASVEQGGDVRQAEQVQENLTRIVENAEEVPDLEPPPVVNTAEEEGTIKSMGDIISKEPAYYKADGPQSGMSRIAKIDSFTEDLDKPTSGIINASKSLEDGEPESGMSRVVKIDGFTEDPDKLPKTMIEKHHSENPDIPSADSVHPEENREK